MNSYYNNTQSQEAYYKWLQDKNMERKLERQRLIMMLQLLKLLDEVKIERLKCNEERYNNWLAEKNRMKKEQENKQQMIIKLEKLQKEVKNQLKVQKHKAWLEEKMQLETKQLQKELELKKIQELINRRRQRRKNALQRYNEWMQRKNQENLYNIYVKKTVAAREAQKRELRRKASREAYEEWVIKSKNKPLPVPSNRGLESLNTSVSVGFINPEPWMPNINIGKH